MKTYTSKYQHNMYIKHLFQLFEIFKWQFFKIGETGCMCTQVNRVFPPTKLLLDTPTYLRRRLGDWQLMHRQLRLSVRNLACRCDGCVHRPIVHYVFWFKRIENGPLSFSPEVLSRMVFSSAPPGQTETALAGDAGWSRQRKDTGL
jgi:hypothetical protein